MPSPNLGHYNTAESPQTMDFGHYFASTSYGKIMFVDHLFPTFKHFNP